MTASLEAQALAEQWVADPDAMSEESREALLDWIRSLFDSAGSRAIACLVIAEYLGRSLRDVLALCEESGCLP